MLFDVLQVIISCFLWGFVYGLILTGIGDQICRRQSGQWFAAYRYTILEDEDDAGDN